MDESPPAPVDGPGPCDESRSGAPAEAPPPAPEDDIDPRPSYRPPRSFLHLPGTRDLYRLTRRR